MSQPKDSSVTWMKFFGALYAAWLLLVGTTAIFAGIRLFSSLFLHDAVLSVFVVFVGVFTLFLNGKLIKRLWSDPQTLVTWYQVHRKTVLVSVAVTLVLWIVVMGAVQLGISIPTIILLPIFAGQQIGSFLLIHLHAFLEFGFVADLFPLTSQVLARLLEPLPLIAQILFVYTIVSWFTEKKK